MKGLIFLILLLFSPKAFSNQNSLIASAVREILNEFFAKKAWTVDLINFERNNGKSSEFMEQLLLRKGDSVMIEVHNG